MQPLVFDIMIYGFLVFGALVIFGFLFGFFRIGKKSVNFVSVSVLIFVVILGWTVFYGSFIEPKKLVVTEYAWKNVAPDIAEKMDGLKLALISDFHIGPYKKKKWVSKVAETLRRLSPDLVILAGDFVSADYRYMPDDDFAPLASLHPDFGIFGVFGNHDYGYTKEEIRSEAGVLRREKIRGALEKGGIRMLVNESIKLSAENIDFVLGGVDELWTFRANIEKTFETGAAGNNVSAVKILVSHNPDIILYTKQHVDLVLAGHTHAGQIRFPLLGAVPQIPTELGNHFDKGVFYFKKPDGKKLPLLITSGIGESGPRARLLAPPEIAIIR